MADAGGRPLRILALAQTPPPVHGAAVMGRIAVDVLSDTPGFETRHIALNFAADLSTVGRFRLAKIARLFVVVARVLASRAMFRPDIVYFTFCPSGIAFVRDLGLLAVLRLMGLSVVIHLHGQGIARRSAPVKGWLRRMLRGQRAIVLSPRLFADVADVVGDEEAVFLPNCLAGTLPPMSKDGRAGTPPRLLFFTNIKQDKGAALFLATLERLAADGIDFSARMAGHRDGSAFADAFIRDVGRAEAEGRIDVRYEGPRYGAAKAALFDWADVLVHPTMNDAQPLVILEAMASGLAVVSTTVGGIPDVVEDGMSGVLVPRGDGDALHAAVAGLISDRAAIAALGTAGRRAAEQRFTPETFRRQLVGIMTEFARARGLRA
jgi:glycosyltransferase involved in cell wall biosynthesis